MLMIFLGVVAAAIMGFAIDERHPPIDRPRTEFPLPMNQVGGGSAQRVAIRPLSELKYENIVRQAYDFSCGSAALTTVLRFHLGIDVNEQQAMEGMMANGERDKIIARRGFSLLDMKRYVATLGSDAAGFRAEIADLEKLQDPAIVPIDYAGSKHFVVLRGVREGKVYLADPSAGHIAFSVADFAKLWDRNTLFVIYPSKKTPLVTSSLRLTDRELGVIDPDLVRTNAVLAPADNTTALTRAVETGLGYMIRRQ